MRAPKALSVALSLCIVAATAAASQEPFPRSIQVPGTDLAFRVGGYVKVDFIQDFDDIGDAFEFSTKTIPTGPPSGLGPRNTIHARETRINLEVRGPRRVRAFVEGDFFGTGNTFRLRHAYGEIGRLLAGQTWSTFQDISARPLTVDFEGPDGEVFVRQAMLRWTQPLSHRALWAIALENATPQFAAGPNAGVVQASLPDLVTNVRLTTSRGHAQFSGLVRQIRFDGLPPSTDESTIGWGVNGSFRIRVAGSDELMGQGVFGSGISRYIESFGGQNVDAVFDAANALQAISLYVLNLGYIHHWRRGLKSGLAVSTADLDPDPAQPAGSIEQTRDARINLIATPVPMVDLGGEVLYGRRRDVSGAIGEAWRFQFAVTFRFN